jgi:O-antigen biosynthesis protein WbqP
MIYKCKLKKESALTIGLEMSKKTAPASQAIALRQPPFLGMAFKRLTDIMLSLTAIVVLLPVLLIVAIGIRLDSHGPALFRQRRIGKDGRIFEIYKFRTMHEGTPDVATDKMQGMPSPITKIGKVLRKTSLDELPQLFNILKGEMSLVGPRPALYNQYELTEAREANGVLLFPPGITGWAQVNGRDEISDEKKVELDRWYCQNWNYFLDWKIVFMTFQTVGSARGAM